MSSATAAPTRTASTWTPGVALGMRRLSVIDLAGSHQPVATEDGDVRAVFNGEIYNFAELRAQI